MVLASVRAAVSSALFGVNRKERRMPLPYVDQSLFHLTGGPSKYDLMLALFDGRGNEQRLVTFSLQHIGEIEVRIMGVDREDGSAESWVFKGYAESFAQPGPNKVEGYFHTQRRHGHVRFV